MVEELLQTRLLLEDVVGVEWQPPSCPMIVGEPEQSAAANALNSGGVNFKGCSPTVIRAMGTKSSLSPTTAPCWPFRGNMADSRESCLLGANLVHDPSAGTLIVWLAAPEQSPVKYCVEVQTNPLRMASQLVFMLWVGLIWLHTPTASAETPWLAPPQVLSPRVKVVFDDHRAIKGEGEG